MGLLGRKLGGGGSALIADAEAIPLLNEAWQVGPVCVRLGWGGVWMRTSGCHVTKDGHGRSEETKLVALLPARLVDTYWFCPARRPSVIFSSLLFSSPPRPVPPVPSHAFVPFPSHAFVPFPCNAPFFRFSSGRVFLPPRQEIAPAPLDVYMEGAAAWLGVLLRCPAYGPDEVSQRWVPPSQKHHVVSRARQETKKEEEDKRREENPNRIKTHSGRG